MKVFLSSIALLLTLLAAAISAQAAVNRGIMEVEFLYMIQFADGRAETLRQPIDMFFDRKAEELYILDPGSHAIFVYDRNGMFQQKIALDVSDGSPMLVAVDGKGQIYAARSSNSKIALMDFRGETLDVLELPDGNAPGNQEFPSYMERGPDGAVYVLTNKSRMFRLDPEGLNHEKLDITGEGSAPALITGMTIDPQGRFLFSDMRPYSVVAYEPGARKFERYGAAGILYGQLARPSSLTTDQAGHVFVANTVTHKISCLDRQGNFIEEFGRLGEQLGQFYMPRKVVSNGVDTIFVLENTLKRVQAFRVRFLQEEPQTKLGSGDGSGIPLKGGDSAVPASS